MRWLDRDTRITGAELEQRYSQWRATEDGAQKLRRIALGVGAAVALGAAAVVTTNVSSINTQTAQLREHSAELSEAIVELSASREALASASVSWDTVQETAESRAEAVAAAQNTFAQLYWDSTQSPSTEDGALSEPVMQIAEHRRALAEFFAPATFVLDDEEIYGFDTGLQLDEAVIDPRLAWFIAWTSPDSTLSPEQYQWRVHALSPDPADPARAVVSWANVGPDDEVLAFAQSSFVATDGGDDGAFEQLSLNISTKGVKYAQGTGVDALAGALADTADEEDQQ